MDIIKDIWFFLELFGLDSAAAGILSWVVGVVVAIVAVVSLVSLTLYLLKAAGLHNAAKRRGVAHAWMAWVPVLDYWVAGSLSDQYKQTVRGKASYNRIILLVLAVGGWLVSLAARAAAGGGIAEIIRCVSDGDVAGLVYASTLTSGGSALLDVLNTCLSLALFVFWHMTLYDIYSAANPKTKVVFLVLGIIFSVTIPFFLFFSRKKDEGMRIPQTEKVCTGEVV